MDRKNNGNEKKKRRNRGKERQGATTSRDPSELARDRSAVSRAIRECNIDGSQQKAGAKVWPAEYSRADADQATSAGIHGSTPASTSREQAEEPRIMQQTAVVNLTDCNADESLDPGNGSRDGSTIELRDDLENSNIDASENESEEVRRPVDDSGSDQLMRLEHEDAVEQLQKLTEALLCEQDASALLREEFDGEIATRSALEADLQSQIDLLKAEISSLNENLVGRQNQMNHLTLTNVELQKQMNMQTELLSAEINLLTTENGALHRMVDESRAELQMLTAAHAHVQPSGGNQAEVQSLTSDMQRLVRENEELRSSVTARDDEIKRLRESYEEAEERRMLSERDSQEGEAMGTSDGQNARWTGWSVKDPNALAAAVGEELRLQKLSIAHTVEKLLGENDNLIKKVNEQAALIVDLTRIPPQQQPVDSHQSFLEPDRIDMESSFVTVTAHGAEPAHVYSNDPMRNGINHGDQRISTVEPASADVQSERVDDAASQPSQQQITICLEASPSESIPALVEQAARVQPAQSSQNPSSGSASRIVRAPFRFLSAVAGYISGRDLAKMSWTKVR